MVFGNSCSSEECWSLNAAIAGAALPRPQRAVRRAQLQRARRQCGYAYGVPLPHAPLYRRQIWGTKYRADKKCPMFDDRYR